MAARGASIQIKILRVPSVGCPKPSPGHGRRQNTLHKISPPTFSARARVSDITPFGVERIATPRPLAMVGKSCTLE